MSPRAVSPWTWRLALRDHGPADRSVLLTLYTILTYMDRNGFAYPSQQLIAAGARVCVRTVQRHTEKAERAGWLGVEFAGRGGKGWRHYVYRAAVPDHLQLERDELKASDAITADWGGIGIKGGDTLVSSRANGSDIQVSPRSGNAGTEGGDKRGEKVATNHHEGGDTGDEKVATPGCRTNSRSETPAIRTHAPEEAHSAQSRVARSTGSHTRDKSPKKVTGVPRRRADRRH